MASRGAVLVVDDDAGMVETLEDILSASGYDVATASSGSAAVTMVRRSRYDVAVMDVRMPGLNGVEALREVRALAPAMNVIMMTAFTRDELVEEAWRATPLAILSKPLDVGRVLSLIEAGARRVPEPPSA